MVDTTLIRQGLPVVDREGRPVGTVTDLDAGRIRVARHAPGGGEQFLPLAEISAVDDDRVTSQLTLEEIDALVRDGEHREHTEG